MGAKETTPNPDPRPEFPSKRFVRNFRIAQTVLKPLVLFCVLAAVLRKLLPFALSGELEEYVKDVYSRLDAWEVAVNGWLVAAAVCLAVYLAVFRWPAAKRARPVYLVDFEAFRPPDVLKVDRADARRGAYLCGKFNEESLAFQSRIAERAGLGDKTFLPPGLRVENVRNDMESARDEAEMVMFGSIQELLDKTGMKPKDIDIVIVNCSLFNPTPSLSAMIVNHFKMRSDIITYNLSGMGCSAGVIALDLARELLQVYPNKNAIVMSTENITQNWYFGNERSMLIPNVLFRLGGAAMLLSNKKSDRSRAKYELQRVIRVHMGADDMAYRCVYQRPDSEGQKGVELNKDLVRVASNALRKNMTRMGPLVLPWSEKFFVGLNLVAAKVLRIRVRAYVPDFKTAFDHFCLHAGGRSVIEGLAKQLEIPKIKTDPSFQTLHWYGNTSSSTIWYSLAYIESCQKVKKGDIVWQVGFGSGFKCNSAVWKAVRNIRVTHKAWEHRVGKEPSPIPGTEKGSKE